MNYKEIEQGFNKWLSSNIESFKNKLPKYSGFAMDHREIKEMMKSVEVRFEEDKYYNNKVVHSSDIDLSGDNYYRYNGPGNLYINLEVNTHPGDMTNTYRTIAEVVSANVMSYLKFFGIDGYKAFFQVDVSFIFMGEIIHVVDANVYDDYGWDKVEYGKNQYWEKVDKEPLQESVTTKLNGRSIEINNDGTVSIENHNGEMVKIRFYVKLLSDINVKDIKIQRNGLKVTGKSGRSELISNEHVKQIISFVDTGRPDVLDSGNAFKPNISLKKV